MDENPDGMINPLTPAPENTEPIEPLPEENLVQPTPVVPVMPEEPVTPVEPVAPVEPVSPSEPTIQQTFAQETIEPVSQDVSTTSVSPKKKNTNLIIAIILGVIAIGCAVAAILMFTVFKPTDGGSGNSGGSSTGGTDTPSTDTISTIDSCPGCVFAYTKSNIVFNPDYSQLPYKSVDSSIYKTDWRDVEESGHGAFLGFVLDDENKPTKMYACGVLEDDKPYCLEGSLDDEYGGNQATRLEKYKGNISAVESVWATDKINDYTIDYQNDYEYKLVDGKYQSVIYLEKDTQRGAVAVYDKDWVFCVVNNYGTGYCSDYWLK